MKKKRVGLLGIRNKIFACFIIPVVFMAVVGYISYRQSAKGLNDRFIESTTQTIDMAVDYLDMSNTFIQSEAMRYMMDAGIENYVIGMPGKKPAEKGKYYSDERVVLMSSQSTNPFIKDIHIVTKNAYDMLSTAVQDKLPGVYDEYLEELKKTNDPSQLPRWVSSHDIIDDALSLDKNGYLYSFQIQDGSKLAYIIVDVDKETIFNILNGMDFGKGSTVGLVLPDGSEFAIDPDSETVLTDTVFTNQSFYDPEMEAGYKNVTYNGADYIYMYKKSEFNNMAVCALIPLVTVTGQAESIKTMTVIMVAVAAVLAALIGTIIASGIQNNMKRISKKLDEVANGDLTVDVKAKGRDEFQFLANSASNMIVNNKKLIYKLSDTAYNLEGSARDVNEASTAISDYSGQIGAAIDEINAGIVRQEEHASECISVTNNLSERIKEINADVDEIERAIQDTEQMINEGTDMVNNLAVRAAETSELSARVGENILKLQKDALSITEFVETINAISNKTNLLSLNASIEAARAGEAGRGFAVVADEIRQLADQSSSATVEIDDKIGKIDGHSRISVESAQHAEEVVRQQQGDVESVIEVFDKIRERMQVLIEAVRKITDSAMLADSERKEAVSAVRQISEIINSTSDSSSKVSSIADSLLDSVDRLGRTADVLDSDMNGLKNEISAFRVGND